MQARRQNPRESVCLLVFCAASAAYFAFLHRAVPQFPGAELQAVIDGTASTPFQYRVLMPAVIGSARALIDQIRPIPLNHVVFAVETIAVLIAFYLLDQLVRQRFQGGLATRSTACAGLTAILFFNYIIGTFANWYFAPDIGAIVLTFLLLHCLSTGRLGLYYAVFAVAVLNRETVAFVTLVFLAYRWADCGWPSRIAHVAAQAAIWLAVKIGLFFLFCDNPGAGLISTSPGDYGASAAATSRLWGNLQALTELGTGLRTASVFGFLWLILLARWGELRDPLVRGGLILVVPSFLIVHLLVGNLSELRLYNELVPLVALGIAELAARRERRPDAARCG